MTPLKCHFPHVNQCVTRGTLHIYIGRVASRHRPGGATAPALGAARHARAGGYLPPIEQKGPKSGQLKGSERGLFTWSTTHERRLVEDGERGR